MARALKDIVTNWADHYGVAPEPDDLGRHVLTFDGAQEVFVSQVGSTVIFEAPLGSIPARRDQAEPLLERLLSLQLARAAKTPSTLALSEEHDALVVICACDADDITSVEYEEILGDMVNAAAFWIKQMKSGPADDAPPPRVQMMFP